MPSDTIQYALWPGIEGVEEATCTISHSIGPSVAALITSPMYISEHEVQLLTQSPAIFINSAPIATPTLIRAKKKGPAKQGTLVFGDGKRRYILQDCIVSRATPTKTRRGTILTLEILDRRWRWQFPTVSGAYNLRDDAMKLVPWTIRSPVELARICLDKMGETGYTLDLPDGLKEADGANIERYLKAGENFRQTLTNPKVIWDETNAARALSALCEKFGCRPIFQPNADRVVVMPIGKGKPLPELPYEVIAPTVTEYPKPKSVRAAGAQIAYQLRFLVEPVGKDWHGLFVPINELSFAPPTGGDNQVSQIRYLGASPTNCYAKVSLKDKLGKEFNFNATATSGTVAQLLDAIRDKLQAYPDFGKFISLERLNTPERLKFTAKVKGQPFALDAGVIEPSEPGFGAETLTLSQNAFSCWEDCPPPYFPTVQPTDRLSYREAQALASAYVWKAFRIRMIDPITGKAPYVVPNYGKLKRRQQVILTNRKVELVVPSPRIPGAINKDNILAPFNATSGLGFGFNFLSLVPQMILNGVLPEFYDGTARAQKAVVRGSVFQRSTDVFWYPVAGDTDFNTPPNSRVFADFQVVPQEQMIMFSNYVFNLQLLAGGNAVITPPKLELECACYLTDERTSQPVRFYDELAIGGEGPTETEVFEDIEIGVIPKYPKPDELASPTNKPNGFIISDEADNRARTGHYLRFMARKYQTPVGEFRKYIGIVDIDPDGYTQQVTVTVGSGGASTLVSANGEHSSTIPDYDTRQRNEMLPPNLAAKAANMIERQIIQGFLPGAKPAE